MARPSTFLAMRILWTSSGPSAMRSVRAPVYIAASGRSFVIPAAPQTWIARSTTRVVRVRDEDLDRGDVGSRCVEPSVDLLGGVDRHQPGSLDVDVAVGDEALDELLVHRASRRAPRATVARSTIRSNARHI